MLFQCGFTLIELMVALAISLILLFGMSVILFSNKESFLAQQQLGGLQENARLVSVLLSQNIQHAGYHVDADANPASVFSSGVSAISGSSPTPVPNAVVDTMNSFVRDQTVKISFEAEGDLVDCVGDAVGTASAAAINTNQYLIDNQEQLRCVSPGGTRRVLAGNVTAMVVRYGVDTNGDNSVNRYVWANEVSVGEWDNVISVRIALLLHSDKSKNEGKHLKSVASTQTFNLLGIKVKTPNDRLAYREVNLTIALPNRLHRIFI